MSEVKKAVILIYTDSGFNKSSKNDFRFKGFIDELNANDFVEETNYKVISGCKSEKDLSKEIDKLLDSNFIIDGIFGRTDSVAIHAMYKLIDCGFNIPKDCSIIGVNNSRISRYSTPQLSSLDINREEIAKAIIKLLENRFKEQPQDFSTISICSNLIKRASLC